MIEQDGKPIGSIAQRTGGEEEYEARRRAMGGMLKGAIFMGLVVGMGECSGPHLNSNASILKVIAAALILAAAGQVLFKIVDGVIFRSSYKDNVDWIRCAIEDCRYTIERKMERE